MSSTPKNIAAVLHKAGTPLVVEPAPYTPPAAHQLIIEAKAVGIAPIDSYMQKMGAGLFPWLKLPLIPGVDVAGVVHEAGSSPAAAKFKVGDRVTATANGCVTSINPEAAYQKYVVVDADVTAKIPEKVGFTDAAMLPLAIATAAMGLYDKKQLALRYPDPEFDFTKRDGEDKEYVLFWGGATTIAAVGMQMVRSSGYGVVATASLKHEAYLKSLGADVVLDYKSPAVMDDLKKFFSEHATAGALSCAGGCALKCAEVMQAATKGRKYVVMVSRPSEEEEKGLEEMEGVEGGFPFGDMRGHEAAPAIWDRYLPGAMKNGRFVCAPEKIVAGKGLESLNEAIIRWDQGVSCQKVVVSLEEERVSSEVGV